MVVNNFLENCVGSVNRGANTEEYEQVFEAAYQEKVSNYQNAKGTIYISELTEV